MIAAAPPLTKTEKVAIAIMCVAVWAAVLLVVAYGEHETRRAAREWPPHLTQERIPTHVSHRP